MWADDTAAIASVLRALRGAADAGDQWAAWAMAVLHLFLRPVAAIGVFVDSFSSLRAIRGHLTSYFVLGANVSCVSGTGRA